MTKLPKEKAILVDIDGTISDDTIRYNLSLKENGKVDWNSYFDNDLILNDKVNNDLKNRIIKYSKEYKIIFLTGRPEFLRDATIKWLDMNNIPFNDLVMRNKSKRYLDITDYKTKEIKKLKKYYNFMIAFDDLEEAIQAIKNNNIEFEKIFLGRKK